jgi:hypothetical protein
MPKNIKFALMMNGQEVRTVDDLKNNFHAQDMLALYQGGVLRRWLKAEGLEEYGEALDIIEADTLDTAGILSALAAVFLDSPEVSLEGVAHYIDFLQKNANAVQELRQGEFERESVIGAYHKEYYSLKGEMIDREYDMFFAREAVKQISEQYLELFILDFKTFISEMKEQSPAVIFTLLTNAKIRELLKEKNLESEVVRIAKELLNSPYFSAFIPFKNNVPHEHTIDTLIKTSYKDTDGAWDDIEPDTSKQYMIMNMPESCKARDFSLRKDIEKRVEINSTKALEEFPIVNGIEYNSRNATEPLIYMVV